MADLPGDWVNEESEDGDIIYINMRTGQRTFEHPCDEYYRQLVIKERKKKGHLKKNPTQTAPFHPLGFGGNNQVQEKKIDPLVKLEMEKKQKKMEEQKKTEFE